jgi:hypothetical protein
MVSNVTTLQSAIGDLEDLPLHHGDQEIRSPERGGTWAQDRWRFDGLVDGHHHHEKYLDGNARICAIAKDNGSEWQSGAGFTVAMRDLYETGGRAAVAQALGKDPDSDYLDRLIGREFNVGAFGQRREVWDAACSLITGAGPYAHVHPTQDRSLTYREVARIQGWPDDLRVDYDGSAYGGEAIGAVWGKAVGVAISTHAGQEVAEWLEGDITGKTPGVRIGNREWLIDEMAASRHLRRQSSDAKKTARIS